MDEEDDNPAAPRCPDGTDDCSEAEGCGCDTLAAPAQLNWMRWLTRRR